MGVVFGLSPAMWNPLLIRSKYPPNINNNKQIWRKWNKKFSIGRADRARAQNMQKSGSIHELVPATGGILILYFDFKTLRHGFRELGHQFWHDCSSWQYLWQNSKGWFIIFYLFRSEGAILRFFGAFRQLWLKEKHRPVLTCSILPWRTTMPCFGFHLSSTYCAKRILL